MRPCIAAIAGFTVDLEISDPFQFLRSIILPPKIVQQFFVITCISTSFSASNVLIKMLSLQSETTSKKYSPSHLGFDASLQTIKEET